MGRMHGINHGYDLDGTICNQRKPTGFQKWLLTYFGTKYAWWFHHNNYVILVPEDPFIIITARPEKDRKYTQRWLDRHGIHPTKLIMMKKFSRDYKVVGEYKAMEIIANRLTFYYEDNREVFLEIIKILSTKPHPIKCFLVSEGKILMTEIVENN